MLNLNHRDPRPIYEQIRTQLQKLILSGAMPAGEKLPSVRDLAAQLAINPNTIQRAYRELESEGYTLSIAGKGSFVAETASIRAQKRETAVSVFLSSAEALRELGFSAEDLIDLLSKKKEETIHD
ncbi:MAG: GntR family transcriptional regulator [Clostridia bacterium]|nr:GntR family transcriptional regulator [Clostridia bacterium]